MRENLFPNKKKLLSYFSSSIGEIQCFFFTFLVFKCFEQMFHCFWAFLFLGKCTLNKILCELILKKISKRFKLCELITKKYSNQGNNNTESGIPMEVEEYVEEKFGM